MDDVRRVSKVLLRTLFDGGGDYRKDCEETAVEVLHAVGKLTKVKVTANIDGHLDRHGYIVGVFDSHRVLVYINYTNLLNLSPDQYEILDRQIEEGCDT